MRITSQALHKASASLTSGRAEAGSSIVRGQQCYLWDPLQMRVSIELVEHRCSIKSARPQEVTVKSRHVCSDG